MKKLFSLILALLLILSSFSGCKKEPAETQPSTQSTVPVEPGLELEENGVVYESLAQKAVVKTALAYLARGARIQYDDTNMLTAGAPTMYRWQHGVRLSPEEYTAQNTGYSNCAAFTYDVYLAALDMKIGGYTTKTLTGVGGKQRIYSYYPTGEETEEQRQAVEAEFRSKLKPADLIIIRYNGAKEGNGHAMLYVGSKVLEGVEGYRGTATEGSNSSDSVEDTRFNYDIIHSTGSNYQYATGTEKYESKGTVQMMSVGSLFDATTGRYLFGKLKSIVILRPLEVFKKDIPQNTLNRMKNLHNIVAEKLCSHPSGHTVNPGDLVNYIFSVTNKNDKEVTVTIEDTVPALATLESADKTEICSVAGDRLSWQLTIPANTTATLNYTVKVKKDAKPGQSLAGDQGTVGGVSVPCHEVFVARTLTQQEQTDLIAAVQALADNRLLRGAALVNALYDKTLKVESIFLDEFASIKDSVFKTVEDLSYLNGSNPYTDAIAPGLFGGRNLMQRNLALDNMSQYFRLEARRTRLPSADQLMVGDILLAETSAAENNQIMLLCTGDQMLNLLSGKEIEYLPTQDCLNPAISYKRFVILRPSMLLDRQEQPQ